MLLACFNTPVNCDCCPAGAWVVDQAPGSGQLSKHTRECHSWLLPLLCFAVLCCAGDWVVDLALGGATLAAACGKEVLLFR